MVERSPAAEPFFGATHVNLLRHPVWVVLVAILVMLAMAAATAFIVLRGCDEREYPGGR